MITKMNPHDMKMARILLGEGMAKTECASKFEVHASTLDRFLKEDEELGYAAYSTRMLIEWKKDSFLGKRLWEIHEMMRELGWKGSKSRLKSSLISMGINYCKQRGPLGEYELDGVVGLAALCRKHGKKESTVSSRIEKGMTLRQALTEPVKPKTIHIYGDLIGVHRIAKHFKVSSSALCNHLNSGKTVEEAIDKIRERQKNH